ncbi:cupin domain-containing protein [Natrinema sp. J7-2]|uniref:cupin domain-containing protein n=1 Tax=Natrinema sp. (strain J7-2) TaxID=406552 RepID=UPI0031BA61DC
MACHVHETQEEAFLVFSGTLHVETPAGECVVSEGSMFAAQLDSPHRAYNPDDADGSVSVVAIGAPSVDDVAPSDPAE